MAPPPRQGRKNSHVNVRAFSSLASKTSRRHKLQKAKSSAARSSSLNLARGSGASSKGSAGQYRGGTGGSDQLVASGLAASPLLISFIGITSRQSARLAGSFLRNAACQLDAASSSAPAQHSPPPHASKGVEASSWSAPFMARRFKRRVQLLTPLECEDAIQNPTAFLDVAKLADVVVFVQDEQADDEEVPYDAMPHLQEAFRLLRAVGVANVVGASVVDNNSSTNFMERDGTASKKDARRREVAIAARRKALGAALNSSGVGGASNKTDTVFELHADHTGNRHAMAAHDTALRHLCGIDAAAASRSLVATSAKKFGSSAQVAAATLKAGVPQWRRHRAYMVADHATFRDSAESVAEGETAACDVMLSGYVRGCADVALSCLQLVHVSGLGDLVPVSINSADDPCAPKRHGTASMDASAASLLARRPADDERAELYAPFASGDEADSDEDERMRPMDLEDEMAAAAGTKTRRKIRVPKGTGNYQSAWYDFGSDDDNADDDDDFSESEEVEVGAGDGGGDASAAAPSAMADGNGANDDGDADIDADMDEDAKAAGDTAALARIREQRRQQTLLGDDIEYPDEVDHAPDADGISGLAAPFLPARQRFRKYRALASLRASPWIEADVDVEERPRRYSRIYRLDEPRRSWRHALFVSRQQRLDLSAAFDESEMGDDDAVMTGVAASCGKYVTITLTGASREACENLAKLGMLSREGESCIVPPTAQDAVLPPIHLVGLLEHEAKHSVVHFSSRRFVASPSDDDALRAARGDRVYKSGADTWLMYTPLRSFSTRCVYSGDAMPSSSGEARRHKIDRFMRPATGSDTTILSSYGPIYQGTMPFIGFVSPQAESAGAGTGASASRPRRLLAISSGAVRGADPDTLLLKRTVLTGWPLRVHKKTATVRFMFHNAEDVRYFMPAELWSKGGGHRRGKIFEPLGTHGGMKVKFDGVIRQSDAVCVSLYKRQYPKDLEWSGYALGWLQDL
ncbi:pre-rRNA-processing TSR1-like protein [Pycnococcus provasolii]